MRQITKESVRAFLDGKNYNKSNMCVEITETCTVMKYQGNRIAYIWNDSNRTISITNCGWTSRTTKERLNGIISMSGVNNKGIVQKAWTWYLDGSEWNGKLIDLN